MSDNLPPLKTNMTNWNITIFFNSGIRLHLHSTVGFSSNPHVSFRGNLDHQILDELPFQKPTVKNTTHAESGEIGKLLLKRQGAPTESFSW